ncbi:tyrosine recombinase [Entomobacter blattae]|uniref:Tyrosine recombinase XerD n=1 Tax=Entomobacter blattae TaxID=2762277 RepID=A0A7H1NUU9_9PROT|nr:tyrosine recombinase [Entomobacter blattae]QNT79559.1 Tyrosine recombinase XerD [Entomobacter blattae]
MVERNYGEAFLEMIVAERGALPNTVSAYRSDLEDFFAFLHTQKTTSVSVSAPLIQEYVQTVSALGYSARTLARKQSSLKQYFLFLLKDGLRKDDPTFQLDAPRLPTSLPKFLSENEIQRLLSACGPPYETRRFLMAQAALEILYSTGVRISELLTLERNAITEGTSTLFIRGKGNKERIVLLSPVACQVALALIEQDRPLKSRWLFPGRNPKRPLTRQAFDSILHDVALRAGIAPQRLSPHVLRHSFASHMLARGADIRSLQMILGHADISTTQIYTHILAERLSTTVRTFHPLSNKTRKRTDHS